MSRPNANSRNASVRSSKSATGSSSRRESQLRPSVTALESSRSPSSRCSTVPTAGASAPSMDYQIQHLLRRECVVRLEIERRCAKDRLRVLDAMTTELDNQLLYVAQFKKEWETTMRGHEAQRQGVAADEAAARRAVEDSYRSATESLLLGHHPQRVTLSAAAAMKPRSPSQHSATSSSGGDE